MVKQRGKKNETFEAGPEASNVPDLETPETDDKSEDEPSNKTVLAAIAALSTEVNLIKSDVCTTIENRITEVSATIRGEISSLNQSIQKCILELKNDSAVHGTTLKELEKCATNHSDTLSTLQTKVVRLTTEV